MYMYKTSTLHECRRTPRKGVLVHACIEFRHLIVHRTPQKCYLGQPIVVLCAKSALISGTNVGLKTPDRGMCIRDWAQLGLSDNCG